MRPDPGPNAVYCAACSSIVTKGMRCIKYGLVAQEQNPIAPLVKVFLLVVGAVVLGLILKDRFLG